MMRGIIYIVILALLFLAPAEKLDIAKLEPVEVVAVQVRDGVTFLLTDTEAWGRGENAVSALTDMRSRTPGVIYLDTAQFLVVTEAAVDQIDRLRPWLKENVRLCSAEDIDMETAALFLEIHGPFPALGEWKNGDFLPKIRDGKILE